MLNPKNSGISASVASYCGPANSYANGVWQSNAVRALAPMPRAGVVSKLYVRFGTAVSTGSFVLAVRKNGSSQTLAVTIDSAHQSASDLVNTVSYAVGDTIDFGVTPTGTPTPAQAEIQFSVMFEGSDAGKSVVFCLTPNTSAASYYGLNSSSGNATEANVAVPCPTSGYFQRMYVKASVGSGGGNSKIYTLYKNGVATALTVTMANVTTNNIDLGGSPVTVVAGDILSLRCEITGSPTASADGIGMDFTPDVDGEAPLFFGAGALANSSTVYHTTGGYGGSVTEGLVSSLAPCDFTAKKLYVLLSTAPTAGRSRAFTGRTGAVGALSDQALTCTVADAATTANDTNGAHAFAVTEGNAVDVSTVPSGTPVTAASFIGMVAFTASAPPAVAKGGTRLMMGV